MRPITASLGENPNTTEQPKPLTVQRVANSSSWFRSVTNALKPTLLGTLPPAAITATIFGAAVAANSGDVFGAAKTIAQVFLTSNGQIIIGGAFALSLGVSSVVNLLVNNSNDKKRIREERATILAQKDQNSNTSAPEFEPEPVLNTPILTIVPSEKIENSAPSKARKISADMIVATLDPQTDSLTDPKDMVSLEEANAVFLKPDSSDLDEAVKQSQYNLTNITRDIAGGMGDYVVQTATGIGMLAVGAVTGIKNLLAKKEDRAPKKTLAERAADVGHALRSEALITAAASMAVGVGTKLAFTAAATSLGLASAAITPILIAGGVTAGIATIVKTRNEWRRDTINDARNAFADDLLAKQGWKMPDSVDLNGQEDTPEQRAKIKSDHLNAAREEVLKSVSPKEYTAKLGLGHLNVFKMFADQHARGKTFKNIGYGLAAGITAGAAAMITGSLTHKDAPPATGGNTNQIPASNNVTAHTPATPSPAATIQAEQASASVTTTVSAPSVTAPAIPADASLLERAKLLADAKGADSNYFLSRLAAAEHGNAQALKDVAQSMIKVDENTALELYRESAKLGNAQAIRDLASLGHPFTPAVVTVSDATTSLSPAPVTPPADITLPLKFHWNPDGTIVNGQNPSTVIPFTRPSVVPPANVLPVEPAKPEPQIIGVNLARPTGTEIAAQPLACLDTRASLTGEVACADVNTKPFDLTASLTYGDYAEVRYGSAFERLFANPGEALTDFFNRLRGHLPTANERLILANTAVTEGRDVASALPPSASVRIVGGTDFVTGRAPVSAPTVTTQAFTSSATDPSVAQPASASVASVDSAFGGGVASDMWFNGMNGDEFDQIPWYRRAPGVY